MMIIRKIKGLLKRVIRKLLTNQSHYGIKLGKGSKLIKPRQVDGQKYIEIGNNSIISEGAWISVYNKKEISNENPTIFIGDNVYIGGRACMTAINGIKIGSGCVISEELYVSDHVHGFNPENGLIAKQPLLSKGKVDIGENSFIGFRVSILPGVILGKNCVVGAHSVVTHSFPDYSMIVGIPARIIKTYSFEHHRWIEIN